MNVTVDLDDLLYVLTSGEIDSAAALKAARKSLLQAVFTAIDVGASN